MKKNTEQLTTIVITRITRTLLLLALTSMGMLLLAACGDSGTAGNSSGVYQKWTSQQVLDTFKKAGLEVENPHAMTNQDYGIAPMTAMEGTRFFLPSLGGSDSGRIEAFSNPEDLAKPKDFYEGLGKQSAALFSHVFTHDNILVQISGSLPADRAKQYEAALNTMK